MTTNRPTICRRSSYISGAPILQFLKFSFFISFSSLSSLPITSPDLFFRSNWTNRSERAIKSERSLAHYRISGQKKTACLSFLAVWTFAKTIIQSRNNFLYWFQCSETNKKLRLRNQTIRKVASCLSESLEASDAVSVGSWWHLLTG